MEILFVALLIVLIVYLIDIIRRKVPFIQKTNNIVMDQKESRITTKNYKKYIIALIIILCYVIWYLDKIYNEIQIINELI